MKEVKFRNNKVCCIADIHLGIHQNSIYWHDITVNWANWLCNELKQQNIEDIVILGDVLHYRDEVAVNTIHVLNKIFNIWKDFNITIIIGNHDSYYKDRADVNSISILDGWNNINVIKELTTTVLYGKTCTFIPWGVDICEVPKSDILFGHLEIESFKMNSIKICEKGVKTKDLIQKSNLTLTGHFHIRSEREYDTCKIIYVGNPYQQDFGDIGTLKGYYILDISNLNTQFVENTTSPKHIKVKLSDLEINLDKSDLVGNIVKVLVDKKVEDNQYLTTFNNISAFKPFSVSTEYTYIENPVINEDIIQYDISGVDIPKAITEFVSLLDIEDKDTISNYCIELYNKCR